MDTEFFLPDARCRCLAYNIQLDPDLFRSDLFQLIFFSCSASGGLDPDPYWGSTPGPLWGTSVLQTPMDFPLLVLARNCTLVIGINNINTVVTALHRQRQTERSLFHHQM